MRTFHISLLALAALVVLAGPAATQQKSEQKTRPSPGATTQPAGKEPAAADKSAADPKVTGYTQLKGTVTQVSRQDKTFTVAAQGTSYTFAYQKAEFPYKAGDAIQLWAPLPAAGSKPPTVQGTTIPHCASGDPLQGLNVHKSSSSSKGPGPGCVPF